MCKKKKKKKKNHTDCKIDLYCGTSIQKSSRPTGVSIKSKYLVQLL